MRNNSEILVSNGDATATVNSNPIDARNLYAISAIVKSSNAGNAGALKLQGSNDSNSSNAPNFTPTNWVDVPNASATVTAGVIAVLEKTQLCYQYVRTVWTPSAGAGTISVITNTQGF